MDELKKDELNGALIEAARYGDIERATSALDQGASIHARSENGNTALKWAALSGKLEMVIFLISRKADVNAQSDCGRTALAAVHSPMIVKTLLEAGADPDIQDDNGMTPLILSMFVRNKETIKFLLAAGANPDLKDGDGNTALHHAVLEVSLPIVRLLTEAGADIKADNNAHLSPVDYAVATELGGAKDIEKHFNEVEKFRKEAAMEKELSVYTTGLPYAIRATSPLKFK